MGGTVDFDLKIWRFENAYVIRIFCNFEHAIPSKSTMKKEKPLLLEIPNPCHENWAEMTPMGMGRFCSHCQKTVTDITKMTDEQVLGLFKQSTDTHCIRAFASQLNRPITLPTTQEPTRFYRIALALGLTLVLTTGADAYARPRPPLVRYNYVLDKDDSTRKETIGTDTIKISGIVVDEGGNPFPGAVVKVMQGGIIKGGTVTEDDGSFEIRPLRTLTQNGTYQLEISSFGYEKKLLTINREQMLNGESLILNLKMAVDTHKVFQVGLITRQPQRPRPIEHKEFDDKERPSLPQLSDYNDLKVVPKKEIQKGNNKTYNAKDLKNFGL